jgi:hypothetical protein
MYLDEIAFWTATLAVSVMAGLVERRKFRRLAEELAAQTDEEGAG